MLLAQVRFSLAKGNGHKGHEAKSAKKGHYFPLGSDY